MVRPEETKRTEILKTLPDLFLERIQQIVPQEQQGDVLQSFSLPGALSIRINTLKGEPEQIKEILRREKVNFKEVAWAREAVILQEEDFSCLKEKTGLTEEFLYRQGLSSMLPVVLLDPGPGDRVLDMCAAPGSKATQMAARMGNCGDLVCLEAVRGRYYKLKSVARLLGAAKIVFHLTDARRYRPRGQGFNKILVDAPCSSEGRFKIEDPKTFAYWSPRKIKEMARKQKGLLLAASRLLQPGGKLVYSTCTFAPEENEEVVQWLLRKTEGTLTLEDAHLSGVASYSAVTQWRGKAFDVQMKRCLRVLPCKEMEGFFIAKFKRNQ